MRLTILAIGFTCLVGCNYSAAGHLDSLKTRAAFDLKCSGGAVQAVELDNDAYGVRCGDQQATYIWDIQRQVWVMNSEGGPTEKASSK